MRERLAEFGRSVLSQSTVRAAIRSLTRPPAVPEFLRRFVHRKLAKHVRFGPEETFVFRTPEGVSLRFLNQGAANYLYWLGQYEPGSTDVFRTLSRRARVILDIGANDGIYSLLAAATNPGARILAFEPAPQNHDVCCCNLALNGAASAAVEAHAIALGDLTGPATFYLSGGTSSLNKDFRSETRGVVVDVVTGDEYLGRLGIPKVDLIKMDTESTEPAVLRGLRERLAADQPDILCEVLAGRTEPQLEELLGPVGYFYYWVRSAGLVPRKQIRGDPTYRHPNYLFSVKPAEQLAALGIPIARDPLSGNA